MDRAAPDSEGGGVMSTIVIILLVLLLVGALPSWPYSSGWGYYPSGGLGLVLLSILILALTGRLWNIITEEEHDAFQDRRSRTHHSRAGCRWRAGIRPEHGERESKEHDAGSEDRYERFLADLEDQDRPVRG